MSDRTTDTGTPAASTSTAAMALPAGWQPWRSSLLTAKTGEPLDYGESGCVAGSTAVYCA